MARPAEDPEGGRPSFARLVRAALAWPITSIRSQLVMLVVFATLLISLMATWVSTAEVEEFLTERLEARFPEMLTAKAGDVRLWYERIDQDLHRFAEQPLVRHHVPALLASSDTQAWATVHGQLAAALSRARSYRAFVICDSLGRPLVGAGAEFDWALDWQPASPAAAGTQSYGVAEHDGQRRHLLSAPVAGDNASLRAVVDLRDLDRLLATGITREPVELYLVDAEGRYIAGTDPLPDAAFRYRDPGPDAGRIALYENARGEEVLGATRTLGRFGWTLVIEQDYAATTAPVRALIVEVVWIVLALALVLVLVAVILALSIVRPLKALSAAADRAASSGDADDADLPRPRGARELRRLTHAFNEMSVRLRASRRELEHRADELRRLSITDGLTGLYNHRYFQEQLPLEAMRAQRAHLRLALLLVDIDDFKAINDTYGHAVGDGVLREVATVMAKEVRAIDLIARYGGEEFGVLTQQRDEAGALTLAEKIRCAVAAVEHRFPRWSEDPDAELRTLRLTVSVGVAMHAPDVDDAAVFTAADAALYAAKLSGKNRVKLGHIDAEDRVS